MKDKINCYTMDKPRKFIWKIQNMKHNNFFWKNKNTCQSLDSNNSRYAVAQSFASYVPQPILSVISASNDAISALRHA